jgi:hypothetical protein
VRVEERRSPGTAPPRARDSNAEIANLAAADALLGILRRLVCPFVPKSGVAAEKPPPTHPDLSAAETLGLVHDCAAAVEQAFGVRHRGA